jgi:transposase-like protein
MGNPTGLSPTAFEASEEAIAARMLQGDPEAFSWLYERYFPRLYDLACRMLGDPDEAMDVAQETFLKFLEGRPRQPPRHFRAYLYAMVITPLSSARWYNWGQIPAEVGPMNRKPNSQNPPCPRCGATHVVKNGSKGGRPRWVCRNCGRSFGPTLGTAMYRLRVTPAEVARTLLVVMRRGSLSAAEEITGHKVETIRRWLRAAARHAEALTEVLVHDLHLSEVEVDAFGSFVKKSVQRLEIRTPRRAGWARVGDV